MSSIPPFSPVGAGAVSYTHLTLPTTDAWCSSRVSPHQLKKKIGSDTGHVR
ncbi:hypothetical protein FRIG_15425 [Frigoribacterium faeni]|uniref:hypothetical protein n=1 Tax=Frigoribacterium faeni TaxID=145483 RepID=UPI001FABA4E7|nr:hypothetical protein [Frigoribacterium faeni]MCJ0702506.1 hypothetical protein [Frigoribacterium faeni]